MPRTYPPLEGDVLRPTSEVIHAALDASKDRWAYMEATGELDGPPVAPSDGVEWLARQSYELITDEYDSVIVLTGKEGISKSVLALRLALSVARLSGVPWSLDRLCYNARELLVAYRSALRDGQRFRTVWFDESVRGIFAGETFDPDQVAITKSMLQNRAIGAVLLLCVPDIRALAKKIRGRRATFWVHVEKRGTWRNPAPSVARVHERDDRIPYLSTDALGFARSKRCPTVTYDPFDEKDPDYAAYKVEKMRRLGDFFDEEIDSIDARAARRKKAAARANV